MPHHFCGQKDLPPTKTSQKPSIHWRSWVSRSIARFNLGQDDANLTNLLAANYMTNSSSRLPSIQACRSLEAMTKPNHIRQLPNSGVKPKNEKKNTLRLVPLPTTSHQTPRRDYTHGFTLTEENTRTRNTRRFFILCGWFGLWLARPSVPCPARKLLVGIRSPNMWHQHPLWKCPLGLQPCAWKWVRFLVPVV